MSSRMSKYYEDTDFVGTRYQKNEELYKEISKNEIDNFEIKSNSTLLSEDSPNEIDVEKIKKILDTKYNETANRQSIRAQIDDKVEEYHEDTKEYDINVVLEKAKEQKNDDYKEERFKKLRDTQFDILKNLNIEKPRDFNLDDDEADIEEENLKTLINTITINENKNKNKDTEASLDILSDLKGSDNTEVLQGLKEEIDEDDDFDTSSEILKKPVKKIVKEEVEDDDEEEKDSETEEVTSELTDSFYTTSNALKQRDFEDIEDFRDSVEVNGVFLKVVIVIIVLIFLVGVALLIKSVYFS